MGRRKWLYFLAGLCIGAGGAYGSLYWYARTHPLTPLAERMPSLEKRAEALVGLLDDPYRRREAFEALLDIGAPAVPSLVAGLGDEDDIVRVSAVVALGIIGDASAAPALIECLDDAAQNVDSRHLTVAALGRIGDASAVPALIECLGDEVELVHEEAAWALGRIGDLSAVPALIEGLAHEERGVRYEAARALGKIGDSSAVPELEKLLPDADPDVREAVEWAIHDIRAAHAED